MTTTLKDVLHTVQVKNAPIVTVIKANGQKENFDPEKLVASIMRSGASRDEASQVLEHITPELHNDITTSEIYRHAFQILHDLEKPAARRYSLRRAVMDLGPSGFPFEDFVAQILQAKGFETVTRQTLMGQCVPHEVDVVAWDNTRLIICEAKFHNELGIKSDIKVALYVKARFDDIRENAFNYGGKDRSVTDAWLITNTKFSSTAVHYGECKKMTMIGWNYPEKGNLQDMIEEEGLHPITCLASLSDGEKKELLAKGIVFCSSVAQDPTILNQVLGPKFDAGSVINEIKDL